MHCTKSQTTFDSLEHNFLETPGLSSATMRMLLCDYSPAYELTDNFLQWVFANVKTKIFDDASYNVKFVYALNKYLQS